MPTLLHIIIINNNKGEFVNHRNLLEKIVLVDLLQISRILLLNSIHKLFTDDHILMWK